LNSKAKRIESDYLEPLFENLEKIWKSKVIQQVYKNREIFGISISDHLEL